MMRYIVIGLVIIGVVLLYLLFAKKKIKRSDSYLYTEMSEIQADMEYYYNSYIIGKEITAENATALDNIATFFVSEYDKLTLEEQYRVFNFTNKYGDSIHHQVIVLKEEAAGEIKNAQYHESLKPYMEEAYEELIKLVYPKVYVLKEKELAQLSYTKFGEVADYIQSLKIKEPEIF